jgi:hypothetical protein
MVALRIESCMKPSLVVPTSLLAGDAHAPVHRCNDW